jgi:hypothetical protein
VHTPTRRALYFLVGLAAICAVLSLVFDVAARRNPSVKVNWIFAMDKRDFDFIVIGSSRAYHTVDIPSVSHATNLEGVNLGLNGAAFPEVALVLERWLSRNSTREIAFEVDPFGLDRNYLHDQMHAYLYVPYIDELVVADALEENYGAQAVAWRFVPMYKYAEWNERIGLRSVIQDMKHLTPEFDTFGTRLSASRMSDSAVRAVRDTVYQIDHERVLGLLRVLDIAKLNRVRVIMFVAPEFGPAMRAARNRDQAIALYRAVARQRKITFLTFDDPTIANDPANFSDAEHLNARGARLFSAQLGTSLADAWKNDSAARAPAPRAP